MLPGLIGKRERLVLTGKEGWGKSTLIYQLVLGAAFGVSPLDLDLHFEPRRVLVLDADPTASGDGLKATQVRGPACPTAITRPDPWSGYQRVSDALETATRLQSGANA